MKKLLSVLIFTLPSLFVEAQESESSTISPDTDTTSTSADMVPPGTDNTERGRHKYFFATNSGVLATPVGFRIGILDRVGGYIATRVGKGYKYEEDLYHPIEAKEATLFSVSAGLILPVATRNTFKVHTFLGIGYGQWFDRPSKSGQTMGVEFEGGIMLSYQRFLVNLGGVLLTGDGNSPKGDMTLGVGFRF